MIKIKKLSLISLLLSITFIFLTGCAIHSDADVKEITTVPEQNCPHSFTGLSVLGATCETDGAEIHECISCGEKIINVVPAIGHDIVRVEASQPTADASGWNDYEYCTRCNYSTIEYIPPVSD